MGSTDVPMDLADRLMGFSVRIVRLCAALPGSPEGRLVQGQLLRSGTSAGAQHREARRARSPAEFISKIESAQQELDETAYWLELSEKIGLLSAGKMKSIRAETEELLAIFAASARKVKKGT